MKVPAEANLRSSLSTVFSTPTSIFPFLLQEAERKAELTNILIGGNRDVPRAKKGKEKGKVCRRKNTEKGYTLKREGNEAERQVGISFIAQTPRNIVRLVLSG